MVVKIPYFSAQSWDHIYAIAHSQKICVHELKEVIPAETGTKAGLWGESFRNPSRKIPENMCFQRNICLGLLVRSQWMSSSRRNELVVLAQLIAAGWLFLSKLLLKPQNRILTEGTGSCIPSPKSWILKKTSPRSSLRTSPNIRTLAITQWNLFWEVCIPDFFPFSIFFNIFPILLSCAMATLAVADGAQVSPARAQSAMGTLPWALLLKKWRIWHLFTGLTTCEVPNLDR